MATCTCNREQLESLARYLYDRTSDAAWLDAHPAMLESYLPAGWQGHTLAELAIALAELGVTAAHCAPSLGDRYIARAPGASFTLETGHTYTVVAVYDGHMDLECDALDVTVAGVRISDPALVRET